MGKFAVTFVAVPGDTGGSGLVGAGSVEIDASGLRVIGRRPRPELAFFGAGAIGLVVAYVMFSIVMDRFGASIETGRGTSRVALMVVGGVILAVSGLAWLVLRKLLPLARVDRRLEFDEISAFELRGERIELFALSRGLGGSTWMVAEDGSAMLEEYVSTREGVRGYR